MSEAIKFGVEPTLFPMMSGREDRATSIFFAVMGMVYPLRNQLLKSIGKSAYLSGKDYNCTLRPTIGGRITKKDIPDALLHLDQKSRWSALVEVKIGAGELDNVQLSNYLHRALEHKVDALITLSNEMCAEPLTPPLRLKPAEKNLRKIPHFHWSWRFIQHEVDLLLQDDGLDDPERAILQQFKSFINHRDSGIKGYSEMPKCWPKFVDTLRDGGSPSESDFDDVIAGWFQESAELAIILSEHLNLPVQEIIKVKTVEERRENALNVLKQDNDLLASFRIENYPDLHVCLDIDRRCLRFEAAHVPTKRVSTPYKQIEHFVKKFYINQDPNEYGSHSDVRLFAKWPHLQRMTDASMTETIVDTLEETLKHSTLIRQDRDKLSNIVLRYTPSNISTSVKSRKKVIEALEERIVYFALTYVTID